MIIRLTCLLTLAILLCRGQDTLPSVPGSSPVTLTPGLAPILEKLDPKQDAGWDTEVFTEAANAQLATLAQVIKKGSTSAPSILATTFQTSPWRPEKLDTVLEDGLIRVARGEIGSGKSLKTLPSMGNTTELHVKFKIYRVEITKQGILTEMIFNASAETPLGKSQQNAIWEVLWTRDAEPKLSRIQVRDFEEITPLAKGGLHFQDDTVSVLGGDMSYREQLSLGSDHWRNRLQIDFGTDVNGLQGIALGDANGDGFDDLYVCQPGGLPNRLYLRQPNGTLRDVSAQAGVDWMELTRSALFVDLDNDGDQDLVLAQDSYYMLMENVGNARFTKRLETRVEAKLRSVSAADMDNDGDLDLFFCGRNPSNDADPDQSVLGFPVPYHDATNGGRNILLSNESGWKFQDRTTALGLEVNNNRFSFASAWEDFDNDGDQDLYVANDFGRNNLYRNDLNRTGKFTDVAAPLGVEDMSAGMSIAWGDANRDGRMDAYVSNMFSSAGNRITYQREFRGGKAASFQRHARGNTLFLNQGDGFKDVSVPAKVTMGRWAWGSQFADLNNDGWEDLYVGNGFITTEDTGDL
ncbi:MAG: hypothetical protein ACI9R3_001217 [Verrucomicrobiales bacterium]|jgi:hypothetical protein